MIFKVTKDTRYLPYLDGLRAIAAMYVVFSHIALYFKFDYSILNRFEAHSISFFAYSHQAVNFFIVISGFSLTIPLVVKNDRSINWIQFYKKRAKRILIPYYAAIFFTLLLIATVIGKKTGTIWDYSLPVTASDIILHVLLIHDLFINHVATISGPFWSISVECRIYILFPILLFIWRKLGLLESVITAVLISGILFVIMYYMHREPNFGILLDRPGVSPYLILFSFGMAASFISFDSRSSSLRNKIPWLLLSIIILILNRWIITKDFFKSPYSFEFDDTLFGGFAACLLISVSGEKAKWLKNIFSFKPLVFIGTFAYSIYLLHLPIIQIVWQYIIHPSDLSLLKEYYIMIGLNIPIVITLSYIFYLLCERPFMNHKKPINIT